MIDRTININLIVEPLRTMGISEQDIFDVLITLVYWKFITDRNKSDRFIAKPLEFEEAAIMPDRNIADTIERALIEWAKSRSNVNESIRVNKQAFDQPGKGNLRKLCANVLSLFPRNWIWSKENIAGLFNDIEAAIANRLPSAHLFLTPADVSKLISNLLIERPAAAVYDPFCRYGELLSEIAITYPNLKMVAGNAASALSEKFVTLKAIMLGFPMTEIKHMPILIENDKKFDIIVSNPPFGAKVTHEYYPAYGWSKRFGGLRQEIDFLCHTLDHLNENGQAAIVIPLGVLSSSGKVLQFRQQLIRTNWLEAIVSLPAKIFYGTPIKTAILVLNRQKTSQDVFFINAEEMGERQRDRNRFSSEDISSVKKIISCLRENQAPDEATTKICLRLSQADLEENNCDLNIATYYKNKFDYDSSRKPSIEIWNELESMKNKLYNYHKKISALVKKL